MVHTYTKYEYKCILKVAILLCKNNNEHSLYVGQ